MREWLAIVSVITFITAMIMGGMALHRYLDIKYPKSLQQQELEVCKLKVRVLESYMK